MDYIDEILKMYNENDGVDNCINSLTELINNKSKNLTELQFINSIILTLAIWSPDVIDPYLSEGKKFKELDDKSKELLFKILKSEFSVLDKENK